MDLLLKTNDSVLKRLDNLNYPAYTDLFRLPNYKVWVGEGDPDRVSYYWLLTHLDLKEATELVRCQKKANYQNGFPNP